MNDEIEQSNMEKETIKDCPLLFDMYGRPATETCISFGFECGKGWHDTLDRTCRELETLNMQFYPKYRLRIQAEQIKEKYGTLHVYYSIIQDPCAIITKIAHLFRYINEYLYDYNKFNYKVKTVVDVEPFDYDDKREITKEKYDEVTDPNYKGVKCCNVDYVTEDGKYFEIVHLRNYGKSHVEPTKHKFLWYIKEFSNRMYHRLRCFTADENADIRNCRTYLDIKANEIVKKAEKDCEEHCEDCGSFMGSEWSPVCTTRGYISYLCESCAKKHGYEYYKNNKLYKNGEEIKDKKHE